MLWPLGSKKASVQQEIAQLALHARCLGSDDGLPDFKFCDFLLCYSDFHHIVEDSNKKNTISITAISLSVLYVPGTGNTYVRV